MEDESLGRLAARAMEVIDRALASLRNALRDEDRADIRSTVLLRLLPRLRSGEPIVNFDAFVVTATHNAASDHLRRSRPERARLKNRLRYLARHGDAFVLWPGEPGPRFGLKGWGESRPPAVLPRRDALPDAAFRRDDERAAVRAVLMQAGGPILLDDLVTFLADAWNIREVEAVDVESLAHEGANAATLIEQRDELSAVWEEIILLPPPQRTALLLNLRDGDGANALALVVFLGVASFGDIAEATGMTPDRLAGLWSELPLDDNRVAGQLSLTRQQVINLRSSARQRLLRRMKVREGRQRS
jgi:DNA-directed RNA polymerase specialized sigma24 family protein